MTLTSRQTFWLAMAWLGFVQSLNWGLAILRVGIWPGNAAALAGFAIVTVIGTAGVARPESAGGPTEQGAIWWSAVVGAVLGTVGLLL